MAVVNYREIADRFSHIDAEFVRASCDFEPGGGSATYVVRFYPWWEHPAYLDAREADSAWGFSDCTDGKREVVVRAVKPVAASISHQIDVIDWAFTTEHPLLWRFDPLTQLFINSPCSSAELVQRLEQRHLPFVSTDDLVRCLDPPGVVAVPRALLLPQQLLAPVEEELARMGVAVFCPNRHTPDHGLIAFVVDGVDYIIAEDFELEVPEFLHRPEWFKPR
jgi:hypothetical protein